MGTIGQGIQGGLAGGSIVSIGGGIQGIGSGIGLGELAGGGTVVIVDGGLAVGGSVSIGAGVAGGWTALNMSGNPPDQPPDNGGNAPQSGQPPRTLQTGGNTINQSTADALGLQRSEAGRALENLKRDLGLPNNHHGKIMSNGDYVDP
jgi:filamentous hemagglutinin